MNWNKQTLRAGALAILLAMVLRLIGSGFFADVLAIFAQPELADFIVGAESGRNPPDATTAPSVSQPEPYIPTIPDEPPTFSSADADTIRIHYDCSKQPDIEKLLTQPLAWDLTGEEPTVLILHSHGTEAFTPTADSTYTEEGGEYRTLDTTRNMISVGDELTRLLEAAGIGVIHDRTCYDHPDYTAAYSNARSATKELLAQYPSIKLVIDLHRDAAENADGSQWGPTTTVHGAKTAQIMFVIGTNSYYNHPQWETNLSIALKLNALMENAHPGVTRPLDLRRQRFNQDLSEGAMIVEIGAAGNTLEEAKNAASVLAEAILQLCHGTAE